MLTTRFIGRPVRLAALFVLAVVAAGCSLEKQSAPSLTGPSEFALSITVTATPDQLPRDGSSQSVVTIVARDPQGRPVSGQRITLGLSGTTPLGTRLSANEVVTGPDGRATFTVTAPIQTGLGGTEIVVAVTPIGENFANTVPRTLRIGLLGPGNTSVPTADFDFTPETPEIRQTVTFDASTTTDEGTPPAPCLDACTYTWNFGDGGTAAGRVVTHAFQTVGSFSVALTVRDAGGQSSTIQKTVPVTATMTDPPVAAFVASPTPKRVDQQINFDASLSTVGAGATITQYTWNFGDGTGIETKTSPQNTHTFKAAATYIVVLTVRDDFGRTATTSQDVIVVP